MEEQVKENLGYHYTSVDSFMKILDGIENGVFKFHASSIFSLNDPTEMKYGYKEIARLIPQVEEELSVNDIRYKLSGIWSIDPQLSLDKWMTIHLLKMNENFQHSCIISYSREGDNLQLWRMYGNNGKGVALGLDVRNYYIERFSADGQRILDWSHIDMKYPRAIDVEYGIIPPKSLPYSLLRAEYSKYWDSVQGITNKDEIIDKQIDAMTQMTIIVAPFVKHTTYSYEKESRIIQVHKKVEDIKIKPDVQRGLKPYIEVDIPTSNMKEIVIGPCSDYDLIKKCIEIKLLQKDIKDVEIVRSVVPYRG